MLVQNIIQFLTSLEFSVPLPKGVKVLDVYKDPAVQEACFLFYKKYYSDQGKRRLILGINPGRLGGGITGIPFTDPVHLDLFCGIKNNWGKKRELSSEFIYQMITAYGGPEKFYKRFYISAVSPLGFVKDNKNVNYYDFPFLAKQIEPFVVQGLQQQLNFPLKTDVCFCIGEVENYKYLTRLNERYQLFDIIQALPHPRFIMQYKRKQKELYIQQYIEVLSNY